MNQEERTNAFDAIRVADSSGEVLARMSAEEMRRFWLLVADLVKAMQAHDQRVREAK